MPPHKKSDFASFSDWLEAEFHFAKSSASTYTSNVRRMFGAVQALTATDLDHFLAAQPYPGAYRAAWKRFVQFGACQGLGIPSPTSVVAKGRGDARIEYFIPGPVCDDLNEIIASGHIPLKLLAQVRWSNVSRAVRSGAWEVADPDSPGTYFRVPIRPVERVEAWAEPASAAAFIIPAEPGSLDPMPYTVSRRLLATRKRTRSQH
jgi:hypothetical protein